jgi:hypothetical protein
MIVRLTCCICCILLLTGCGKKPSQLQPVAAPVGKPGLYAEYPKAQPLPPAPLSPSPQP